jgi:hypothetical protein
LSAAPNLAWPYVVTVTPAVCRLHIWEGGSVSRFVDIHPITNPGSKRIWIFQDASDCTRCNVDHIVIQSPSIGEAAKVASQHT